MTLSIIVPVYNKRKYISTILTQIQAQSFQDYECLLIDDGSTDGSGAICDEFASKDARFKVIHIPNGGVSRARNTGLDIAQGIYVTFIDADDQIHPLFLQNLINCMTSSGADMVISGLKKVWADQRPALVLEVPYRGLYTINDLLPDFAKVQQSIGIYGFSVGKLFSRALVETIRFDERIKLAEDLDFYLKVYQRINTIYFDNHYFYYYLQAAQNSSMLGSSDKIDYYTQLLIQKRLFDFLQSNDAIVNDNGEIMNRRLYDYVFFCIFFAPIPKLKSICEEIRKLDLPKWKKFAGDSVIRTLLLICYEHKWDSLASALLSAYRMLRNIIRKAR